MGVRGCDDTEVNATEILYVANPVGKPPQPQAVTLR